MCTYLLLGGVITGSLEAAIQKEPLSLQQYLETKRSNVPNHSEEGKNTRKRIYEEFKKYSSWKTDSGNYDMGDVVLRLLQLDGTPEFFYSGKQLP